MKKDKIKIYSFSINFLKPYTLYSHLAVLDKLGLENVGLVIF